MQFTYLNQNGRGKDTLTSRRRGAPHENMPIYSVHLSKHAQLMTPTMAAEAASHIARGSHILLHGLPTLR